MPTQKQIREEITTRIVAALESGVSPWRRPWRVSKNSGRPSERRQQEVLQRGESSAAHHCGDAAWVQQQMVGNLPAVGHARLSGQ